MKSYFEKPEKWRDIVDDEKEGLIPGFEDMLGISNSFDHCDNPYGTNEITPTLKKIGFKNIDPESNKINKNCGLKNYLIDDEPINKESNNNKSTEVKSKEEYMPSLLQHIKAMLSKVNGISSNADLVRLGSVLHIVQDYYAHSNYAEVYLNKIWFDKIVTWNEKSDNCRDYSSKNPYSETDRPYVVFKESSLKSIEEIYSNGFKNKLCAKSKNNDKYIFKKSLYTPITTGTYGFEDMLSTCLSMLNEKM